MNIGQFKIDKPVFLAPMAGYTDLPFRLIGKEYGADVVTTEMVSAKGLFYGDEKTARLMVTGPEEAPAGVQLFGSDPGVLEEVVARYIGPTDFAFVDFNAGCPAPKIVKNGDGSALLNNLPLLEEVVRRMAAASPKPLFVKTRLGWDADHIVIREAAERIERAGAACLTIHGRTREAFYSGRADWKPIEAVKRSASIPIILNGDVDGPEQALRAFETTGCDGVAVGRAAVGNPFIFREIRQALDRGTAAGIAPPTDREKIDGAIAHIRRVAAVDSSAYAMRELRKQLVAYTRGIPGSAALRRAIFTLETAQDLIALLEAHGEQAHG